MSDEEEPGYVSLPRTDGLAAALTHAKEQRGWSQERLLQELQTTDPDIVLPEVRRLLRGGGVAVPPSLDLLAAFNNVFPELGIEHLRSLASLPSGEGMHYYPPPESLRLTRAQRAIVDAVIREMVGNAPPQDA